MQVYSSDQKRDTFCILVLENIGYKDLKTFKMGHWCCGALNLLFLFLRACKLIILVGGSDSMLPAMYPKLVSVSKFQCTLIAVKNEKLLPTWVYLSYCSIFDSTYNLSWIHLY